MNKTRFFLLMLLTVAGCGNHQTKGQVISGTDGITVERCNEIVVNIPDHRPKDYNPSIFSKEFGELMKQYRNLDIPEPDGIGEDEFMWYWHSGNGEGFTEKATKSYKLVSVSENKADILLNMHEPYNEGDVVLFVLDKYFHMILVKEKGKWMLDDWIQSYDSDEWYSRKDELKEYLEQVSQQ